jgi:hypothetical protein
MVFLTYKGLVTRNVDTIEYGSQQLDAMTEQLKRLSNKLCKFQALSPDVTATLTLQLSESSDSGIDDSSGAIVDSTDDDKGNDIVAIVDECIAMLRSEDEIDKDALIGKLEELKSQINDFKSKIEKGDTQAAADIVNFIGRLMIDVEMQRSKQGIIEARTLQYGAVMLLSRRAPDLIPLVLISICQWGNADGDTINDVFHAGIGQNSNSPISISQMTINILRVKGAVGMDADQRKSERKRVKDAFKASLRRRYPELIGGSESFKILWDQQTDDDQKTWLAKQNLRTAYEVLCFLRLAPLTPQLGNRGDDKVPNLDKMEQLSDDVLRTRIFNPTIREAYNLMKTNKVNTPGAQEQYLGVWSESERIKEMEQSKIDDLVNSALMLRFISDEQRSARVAEWARNTFLSSSNLGIRQAVIEQIRARQNEQDDVGNDVVGILEDMYDQAIRTDPRMPETPPRQKRGDFDGKRYQSPMTSQGARSPKRPSESTKEIRPEIVNFAEVARLTNQVAAYFDTTTDEFTSDEANSYIKENLSSVNPNVLKAIVNKLRTDSEYAKYNETFGNDEGRPRNKVGIFNQAVNWLCWHIPSIPGTGPHF